jgi:uncharacterized membrane protein YedE/YeeE
MKASAPYANPYVAGAGLGAVLLGCFVLTGQGLGASGAFANAASGVVATVAPQQAGNAYFQSYLQDGLPWTAWIVIELLGVIAGGALSAVLAGRFKLEIARGPRIGGRSRLVLAVSGGGLMGLGAVLARGCTSGQALSGGALLSVGSWAFMVALFAAGFVAAPFLRKVWL